MPAPTSAHSSFSADYHHIDRVRQNGKLNRCDTLPSRSFRVHPSFIAVLRLNIIQQINNESTSLHHNTFRPTTLSRRVQLPDQFHRVPTLGLQYFGSNLDALRLWLRAESASQLNAGVCANLLVDILLQQGQVLRISVTVYLLDRYINCHDSRPRS